MRIQQHHYRTIWQTGEHVSIIDQTQLPFAFEVLTLSSVADMSHAIRTMQVRGAPLIGVAAAYGVALAMRVDPSDQALNAAVATLVATRPTAVNLAWAAHLMQQALLPLPPSQRLQRAWQLAQQLAEEDVAQNTAIGSHGKPLIEHVWMTQVSTGARAPCVQVLTHCNAGWLATVDMGTALAPIYAAYDAGIPIHVWVDETRPRNQGASLTAWELGQHGVPHTVISDNAGGHLMQHGQVDMVIVGADRVSGAGDVCNKIGTYLKALAAQHNGIPFYAAVPTPTIDWQLSDISEIEIEMRDPDEVAFMQGINAQGALTRVRVIPAQSPALNPAFDVTPAHLVTAVITEQGVCTPTQLAQLKHPLKEA